MSAPPVFLLGAPRSGTTWLQNMLGAHPDVATPQELDLFNDYIGPLVASWDRQLPPDDLTAKHDRFKGLPAILTEEQFVAATRDLVLSVHNAVRASKPSARIVLEKTPVYTLYGGLIHRCFPEARFVHIVRDGRDVAASLRRASQSFGRLWATGKIDRAAWIWRVNIEAARRIPNLTPWYCEVRYEDLRGEDGERVLADTLAFCGVDAAPESVHEIYETFRLGPERPAPPSSMVWGGEVVRRVGGIPPEPAGFFGEGRPGNWQALLTPFERLLFDRIAGELLVELGYESDSVWVRASRLTRAASRPRVGLARLLERTRFAAGAARLTFRVRGGPRITHGPFAAPKQPAQPRARQAGGRAA